MSEEIPILGSEDSRGLLKRFLGLHGPPAYIRRAREVEDAFANEVERCRRQREEWLELVRIRLGTLLALAGSWEALGPLLATEDDLNRLQELHAELQPRLRVPVTRTSSLRLLRRALEELAQSIERFNRRWLAYLVKLDLGHVNKLREDYNRYYIIEKECALRSPRLARQGFTPLAPATAADLLARLPPLPEVRPLA